MDKSYLPYLSWIDSQKREMISLAKKWVNINSGSENLGGLQKMRKALKEEFKVLRATNIQEIPLSPRKKITLNGDVVEIPQGKALLIRKRPHAPLQVLLCGHMDTVHSETSVFQKAYRASKTILRGPGAADMKGGLVIMLKALQAFEKTPFYKTVGWEILLTPDEEIGSTGSRPLLLECAKHNIIGLIFEPSSPEATLVSARKGSANYTVVVKGKAAHAGREHHLGRNAISALANFMRELEVLNSSLKHAFINIGYIEGGGPVNIVPAAALCRFNIRATTQKDMATIKKQVHNTAKKCQKQSHTTFRIFEDHERPPKPFDEPTKALFSQLKKCAKDLKISLSWKPSGGVCDGNTLAAAGLPTIDTLGAIGGNIHTSDEYLNIDSLTERAKLVALFLMKIGQGEIKMNFYHRAHRDAENL